MKKNLLHFLRGALGAGGTFLIACAYGPVDNGAPLISGRVMHNTEGLAELNVCARIQEVDYCTRSEPGGAYNIDALPEVLQAATAGFLLCAEDDLGVTAGAVVKTCETLSAGSTPFSVDVEMDEPGM